MAPEKTTLFQGRKEVDKGLLAELHSLADPLLLRKIHERGNPDKLMAAKKD
ncbi:MAG: hypothetical protein KKD39_05485 [Candidatus Altiarchaeota archaeon]|nr:hypothetical protein [Candidatus Altiarchaeota archaeon]